MVFLRGSCAEDLGANFKASLSNLSGLQVPSPDTLLQRLKQLAEPVAFYTPPEVRASNDFSHNDLLNWVNIKLLKALPCFTCRKATLDYNNTLLFH